METNHPEITKPRLASGLVTQATYNGTNHPGQPKQHNKAMPLFAKSFFPAKGMTPATVFIGSHEALEALKARHAGGNSALVCIEAGRDPEAFQWSFIHSLPVSVLADEATSDDQIKSLCIELYRCGARAVTATRLTGRLVAHCVRGAAQ